MSGEKPANLTGSFQQEAGDKSGITQARGAGQGQNAPGGGKGLFTGQHKIKFNSSAINQQNSAGISRLNSEVIGNNSSSGQGVIVGGAAASVVSETTAMRNSHYQQENSTYTWSQGMANQQQPINPPRSR